MSQATFRFPKVKRQEQVRVTSDSGGTTLVARMRANLAGDLPPLLGPDGVTTLYLQSEAGTTTLTGAPTGDGQEAPISSATSASVLVPTAVKTASYTAAVGDYVPVDTTSGNVTVTLPTAPADKAQVGIKHIVRGGTNTVTVALGGSDVINKAGGATLGALTLVNQGAIFQYKASTGVWYVVSDDLPLSGLDARFDTAGAAAAAVPTAVGQAIQKAALGIGYGLQGSTVNPPYLIAPTVGPNLWATSRFTSYSANAGTNGVINTSTITPSLTSDGTTKSLRTRLDLANLYQYGYTSGKYRLTVDVTSTAVTGGQPMSLKVAMLKPDGTVNQWYDTQKKLWTTNQPILQAYQGNPAMSGHRVVVEIDASQASATASQYLEVALDTNSSNSAGSISLSNVSLYQIPAMSPVIRAGWNANPSSGAQFNVEIPMTDQAGNQRFLRYTFQQDGNLMLSPSGANLYYDAALGGNSRFQLPAQTTTNAAYRAGAFYINNADSIFVVLNGSNVQEYRGNTHGGETGRTGTFTTDYQAYVDFGDGNGWQQITQYDNWAYTGFRVKIVQQTKVTRSDQGSPFANIDRIFYIYPDGTMRKDQTVTWLQTQQVTSMIWEMASFSPNNYASGQYAAGFKGRIGVGQNVIKETDFTAKLAPPVASTSTTATTGGTLAGNFQYGLIVTALNNQGETTPSISGTLINVPAGTNTNTVTANWSAVTGATAYAVYFGLPGFERRVATVAAGTLTYTVTGSETPGQSPPLLNSAATQSTSDLISVSNPDWAVYYEPVGQACFSMTMDHSAIQQLTGVQGITARLHRVDQSIVKNYWDFQFINTGTAGPSIAAGTVWSGTTYRIIYLPRDPNRFEQEQTIRGGAIQQLGTIYPT